VLKELASDCWSQPAPSQGFHPGAGAACSYSGCCCYCCGPGQDARRCVGAQCGHEGMRTLLSSGHGAGVHNHVPLPRVAVGRPRCVGPTIGTSGGGGLAVVVAAITAIVVFVIVLVSVATGAAVSVIGRARWRGRRWLSRRGCSVGVEHRRGSRRPGTVHVNLLQ
jgi:hypothetical protein